MKALVIGGAGPIGSHVVDALLADPAYDKVMVLDNVVRGSWENVPPPAIGFAGDVRNQARVRFLVEEADVVFHLAALNIRKVVENPRLAHEVMVDGAFNVIAACADLKKRLILASSNTLYGQAELPTPETHHPWNDATLYGAAKVYAEKCARAFSRTHGLEYVALRYFNVYGPRMADTYSEVLVKWMEAIDAGDPPVVYGPEKTLDLVYMEDVARATLVAARSRVSDVSVNVGTGVETTLDELAHLLLWAMGRSAPQPQLAVDRVATAADVVARRSADIKRAKSLLGWEPRVQLGEGLTRTVEWWRSR
jgi:UDP-glucose 4-epimerase